ncbi:alpha-L-fucosidase [Fulvivirga sediminis]|uniref:alpha-L-fucosidase n=1 Tax=Fulvivirga sediminis TaxID=2803949 RepID=A0A937K0R9_9BACT|nr:alpha-L-fucosidase [Fulvivirga sediminis]MBL3655887.1 alpha-L-fucosidase [Fulvivirga sediminis]
MKRNKFVVIALLALSIVGCKNKKDTPAPEAVGPVPTAEQMAWHKMEKNAFIHFTINTFTDKEWGFGDESPELFNPTDLDADQWVKVLKETGFKGVILTCKHHDGFCLWPSEYTEHDIASSPYKNGEGDIVREVSDACKKYGLKFGVYVSPWDRNRADYGDSTYITYYRNQLKELFTSYGDVFEMWFDGANGGDGYYGGANEERKIDRKTYYHWPKTLEIVREMEPKVLFFSDGGPDLRWGGNELARAGSTNWNTISPDTIYAGMSGIQDLLNRGSENGDQWVPLEANTSIRPGWFYHAKEDSLVKTPEQLLDIYLTSVGRGSTLLLNIPPDKRGLFHENDIASLKGWNALLKKEFANDLTEGASIAASSVRGDEESYAASLVIDDNYDTYWATDDAVNTGSLEIDLGEAKQVKYITIQEYIPLGQRVKSFNVEAWSNGKWEAITEATTIGYKRILRLEEPVNTDKIKINITDSKACPVINNIEIH